MLASHHASTIRGALLFFTVALVSLGAGQTLAHAQETRDPGPFYGFWNLTEPAGDSCVVIIKRGGRISCFFPGSGSSEIMQGSWERTDTRLTATWPNGHRDVFEVLSQTALRRLAYPAGLALTAAPAYENRATMVDRRLPGSLRQEKERIPGTPLPPLTPEKSPTDTPGLLSSPLIGYWQIAQNRGLLASGERNFFLNLQRGGTARVALREWSLGNDEVGTWKTDGTSAIIRWQDGRRDVLKPQGDTYLLVEYSAKQSLEDNPRERRDAERAPVEVAQRLFTAGATDLLTATDVRGSWRPMRNAKPGERLQIDGWGRAFRHSGLGEAEADEGRWRLLTDHVVIEWIDGSRDILRLGAQTLVQESFAPGATPGERPIRVVPVEKVIELDG